MTPRDLIWLRVQDYVAQRRSEASRLMREAKAAAQASDEASELLRLVDTNPDLVSEELDRIDERFLTQTARAMVGPTTDLTKEFPPTCLG